MTADLLHQKIRSYVQSLQRFADQPWYPPFIGTLAALDNLVLIIPNDGILISSTMLTPRRWFILAMCVAIGSTVGALALAALVEYLGLPWILNYFPGIDQTPSWLRTDQFFQEFGLLLVFGVALTPLIQHPAIILAGLANTPLQELALAVFVGRLIKFLIMAYLASHAPRVLGRLWGLKREMQDAGVKVD